MKFLERSITSALDFFKEALFSEEIACSKGFLQSLDPRAKISMLLALILAVCLVSNIYFLLGLYLVSILLAFSSDINILFFIKRVWLFIPLFTSVIAIPAFFMGNAFSAVLFIIRVTTSVSFAVLITITTRHGEILKSLKSFGIPDIFIQILDMTYRYIFFFVKVFEEMHTGLKARLVRKMDLKGAGYWVASRIGFIFRRSMKMSEDVYTAMVARGYKGEFKKYGR